jgi:endonuclease YncB( thermonuclease family)
MLNQKLLEDGFAYEYTYNKPYKYKTLFKSLENDAKENSLGL